MGHLGCLHDNQKLDEMHFRKGPADLDCKDRGDFSTHTISST